MSPRSSSARSDPAPRPDEFEWPPKTDGLSVYEIGPDPWQGLQAASHEVFVSHHSEASPPPAIEDDRLSRRRLAGVITATVIVIGVTSWVLYGALTRPAPIETIHHPAASYPAPASVPPPPRITIVATYPVDGATAASTTTPAATPTTPAAAPRMPVALASAEALAAVVPMSAHVPAPTAVNPRGESTPAVTASEKIRSLLRRYEDAYDRRDVRTAAALWPSLDQQALTRAFAGLERQDVHFDRCDINATEARGSAVCVGTVRYVPSVGRAVEKEDRITWTFDLARSGEDWRIDGLSAR